MSREPDFTDFGGVIGRVLRETMSGATLVTGLTLVIGLGALGYIMDRFEADDAFRVLVHIASALVLARFALNGFVGEWNGTLFSTRGGTWVDAAAVGARYLALSSLWLVPVLILGWKPGLIGEAVGHAMFGGGGTRILSLTTLVIAFLAFTPPVFLIVSVSASRFADLADRGHWEGLFAGRRGDLFAIYVIYLGALAMLALLFLPLFTAVGLQNDELAVVLGLFWLAFASGLAVSLLGRLCGFFAGMPSGGTADIQRAAEPAPPAAPVPAGSVPRPAPAPSSAPPSGTRISAEGTRPVPRPPASATPAARPTPGAPPPPAREASVLNPSGRTPLLDARERVDELAERVEEDPEGAINALRELDDAYAPHPLVQHLLCMTLSRTGRLQDSLAVARRALPLCLERGAVRLAAEIYACHLERSGEFKLPRDTVLALADDLRRNQELAAAEEIYTRILHNDRRERRAVKGMLMIAESHLDRTNYVDARSVYQTLLGMCADSPFAMHMQQGLEEAERRMAKAS